MFNREYFIELADNLCLSGGAIGADSQWGMMAARLGHKVIHWSFEGHRTDVPENTLVRLSEDYLILADPFLLESNKDVKRRFPTSNKNTSNLLRRTYYQIAWTESLYVVGMKNYLHEISGGTAWGVQMYMNRFLKYNEDISKAKFYFFDQNQLVWWNWNGNWNMMSGNPPQPSGIWTGIGTRELSFDGKWIIRKLMGGYPIENTNINNIIPIKELPEIGNKVYVPTIKIKNKGIDDKNGGWATISSIIRGEKNTIYVKIQEFPNECFEWSKLYSMQKELQEEFKLQHAYLKSDDSPENNTETEYYRIK